MVAVTGAAGLLGTHVCAALAEVGHGVRGIDLRPASGPGEEIVADLADAGSAQVALAGADAVVHTAGIPRPTGHSGDEVFMSNVGLAWNVTEACRRNGIGRLVNASSVSVFGPPFNPVPLTLERLPLDDLQPSAPQEAYGLSKHLTEEVVEAAVRRQALTAVSVRMPWLQTEASFAHEAAAGHDDPAVGPANLWAYIDARDAGGAFALAVAAPTDGHLRLLVSAPDSFARDATAELVERHFPGLYRGASPPGHASLIDTSGAERALGFQPEHSLRDVAPHSRTAEEETR